MRLGNPLARAAMAVAGVVSLLAGCGTSGVIDPGVARGPGPAVDGYRLQLSTYTAHAGDVLTVTITGPSSSSSSLVEVTCGIRDRRVSYPMAGVFSGTPGGIDAERRAALVASALPLRFRVPDAVPQSCTVSRSVTVATGVVQPTALLDIR